MSISSLADHGQLPDHRTQEQELTRWGGIVGLAGAALMIGTGAVVGALGLPDADDVETLTDFADIEAGRIAEHFLYLGALVLFALHVLVLHRLLRRSHLAASTFGAAIAELGLVIMAASSLLHVATSPLADLYTAPGTSPEDLRSIEYAWHAGQSVFDTMLATGVLLVPIGIVLLGIAMMRSPFFGSRLAQSSIGLGAVGTLGAVLEIIDPGSSFSAASVLVIVIFHVMTGWRVLSMHRTPTLDLTTGQSTPLP